MRDMKPLMLPKLVAQRKSSKGSLNMPSEPSLSIHSNTDSGFYSASECSTPPTPSYQHGHLRFPSTASSLSSSPPSQDCILEPTNSSGKLPQLTEDVEREDDYVSVSPYRPSMDMDILDGNPLELISRKTGGRQPQDQDKGAQGSRHEWPRKTPESPRHQMK